MITYNFDDQLAESNLYHYFRFQKPGIINDINEAYSFLSSEIDPDEKRLILQACLLTVPEVYKTRSHLKNNSSVDILNSCVSLFHDYYQGNKKLSKKDITNIFRFVCGILFTGEELQCNTKGRKAISELKGLPNANDDLFIYLYDIYRSNSAEYAADSNAASPEDYAIKSAIFRQVINNLKKNTEYWRDAVCALYYEDSNDIELENTLIYYKFTSSLNILNPDYSACIIEPSPFFIRKWLSDSALSKIKCSFVISSEPIRLILSDIYKNQSLVSFASPEEYKKTLSYGPADNTLVFGTRIDKSKLAEIIVLLNESARNEHSLFILAPDNTLLSKTSSTHEALRNIDIKQIDLLPSGILNSTIPQRKVFIQGSFGYFYSNDEQTILVNRYSIDNNNQHQFLYLQPYSFTTSKNDFQSAEFSLREKFENDIKLKLKKTDKKRSEAYTYVFSKELTIRYSLFSVNNEKIRIRAYTVLNDVANNKSQIQNSALERTNMQISDVECWIANDYINSKKHMQTGEVVSIREILSEACKNHFKGQSITLKTFFFMYDELEDLMSANAYSDIKDLLSQDIGSVHLNRVTQKMLLATLEDYYDTQSPKSSVTSLVSAFQTLFDFAINQNHCKYNPAHQIYIKHNDRFEELDEVINALGKHFLSKHEIKDIYKSCINDPNDVLQIGVLLRLFTGLEANILSALQWNDLITKIINEKTVFQLRIEKQISSDGKSIIPFKRSEQVRLFPLAPPLANILLNLKNNILLNEELIGEQAILQGKTQINLFTSITQPSNINRACRDKLKNLNTPEYILPIPNNKYGITEANLNSCYGDIYKNTFRHYLMKESNLQLGELNYLLGIQAPNVDYNNYIDCSCDRLQINMASAIENLWEIISNDRPVN